MGRPVPKGRPRVTRRGTYTPAATVIAETSIASRARAAGARLHDGDIQIALEFAFADQRPRGDIDNLVKTVLDALNGIAYRDDRQVVSLRADILVADTPSTRITIVSLGGTT